MFYNVFYSILTPAYLVGFISLLVYSKVNQSELLIEKYGSKNSVIRKILLSSLFVLVPSFLWLNLFASSSALSDSNLFSTLTLMATILSTQFGVAFITDRVAHEIDRNISRLGYIFMGLACIRYLELTPVLHAPKGQLYMYYIALQVATVILMFVLTSIGSADFRILLMTNSVAISVAHQYLFYFILINLLTVSVFQCIIQKRAGNNRLPVPIGHILIFSALILFLILSTNI